MCRAAALNPTLLSSRRIGAAAPEVDEDSAPQRALRRRSRGDRVDLRPLGLVQIKRGAEKVDLWELVGDIDE